MTDLSELLERCRKATGPDRDLDADLEVTFVRHGWVTSPKDPGAIAATSDHFAVDGKLRYITSQSCKAPPHTASIDAALALVERRLSGWQVNLSIYGSFAEASVGATGAYPRHRATTPPLAILTALLTALGEQP